MEQASFFELCRLIGKRAASMVAGLDGCFLSDGELPLEA
jgi:DNA-directed RNA polymerase subunit K/omega